MKGCWVLFQDHPVLAFDNELDALREAVRTASSVVYVPFGMGFMAVRNGDEVFEPIIDEPVPYIVTEIPNPVVPQAGPVRPNPMGTDEEVAAYVAHLAAQGSGMAPLDQG